MSNPQGYLMVHSMAMHIYYQGRMWGYAELLEELGRGIHFAVLPCGQVIQHNDPRTTLWQARGANKESCAVELLIPGVFDLSALYTKINGDDFYYHHNYYQGLLTVQQHLVDLDYVRNPRFNWDLHSIQSQGRKMDPGSAFSVDKLITMLEARWPHGE